jgi:hypothetical protein
MVCESPVATGGTGSDDHIVPHFDIVIRYPLQAAV